MRTVVAVVSLLVGLALFPIGLLLHRRHPGWAWNYGPQTWLYVLGTLLVAIGVIAVLRGR